MPHLFRRLHGFGIVMQTLFSTAFLLCALAFQPIPSRFRQIRPLRNIKDGHGLNAATCSLIPKIPLPTSPRLADLFNSEIKDSLGRFASYASDAAVKATVEKVGRNQNFFTFARMLFSAYCTYFCDFTFSARFKLLILVE